MALAAAVVLGCITVYRIAPHPRRELRLLVKPNFA